MFLIVKIPASRLLLNLDCCNERLCGEGGNNTDCCRENVLNDNLQPQACETDAEVPDKTLFFQPPPPPTFSFPPNLSFPATLFTHSTILPVAPFLPLFFLPRSWLLWKYISLSVFVLPAASPGWLTVPSSRWMCLLQQCLPPLRKSSWAQNRPTGYFTTAARAHTLNFQFRWPWALGLNMGKQTRH